VRASEAAKAAGEKQIAELSAGDTAADQAQWAVTEAATRAQEGVDPVVLQALFRMPKPADDGKSTYTGVSLASGDFVVIRLDGVSRQEQALTDEEKTTYRRFLASRIGQQDFAAYRKQLEAKADIERF